MKYIISLGGSIIVPDKIDTDFIRQLVRFINAQTKHGRSFHIIVGGGKICRTYQQAAIITHFSAEKINTMDLDLIGIAATRLNAELLRVVFAQSKKVKIYSGEKPGATTDHVAVKRAAKLGVKTVVNLSNIDYVYTADPRKSKNAKKITNLSWSEYLEIFGTRHRPGINAPFDPVAAKLAKDKKISAVILNGRNLPNLKNFFSGKSFRGTVIQ